MRRLVENFKTDHKEICPEYTYRVHLAQDRVRWQAIVNRILEFINGRECFEQLSDYQLLKKSSVEIG
jgi:hypothetical protein